MGKIRRCDPCGSDWKEKINQLWNNYQNVVKSITLNGSRKTPDGQGNIDLGTLESEVEWGDIGGTLSNQSDLQDALDEKATTANLAAVAFTGDYDDLSDKPTIPAAQIQSDWTQADNTKVDYIKNKPALKTVATSGDYDDLTNKPSIPAAQIQSDWTQADNTKVDYIKNKPSLATVATTGDYDDLIDKPTIPDVGSLANYIMVIV